MHERRSTFLRQHRGHAWRIASVDHIFNVPATATHDLIYCSCGWGGWVTKQQGGTV